MGSKIVAKWKFQLLPNKQDLLGVGYRMDAVGKSVETEVDTALPYHFRFHRISKIVLCLGRQEVPKRERPEPDYWEAGGVAIKQMPAFSVRRYAESSEARKFVQLHSVILEAFAWFEAHFSDAQFIGLARAKLPWGSAEPAAPAAGSRRRVRPPVRKPSRKSAS